MNKDIKGITRYTFTNTETGEILSGVFMFEDDEDGIFIRTDTCSADIVGADCGIHPLGIASGIWTYTRN